MKLVDGWYCESATAADFLVHDYDCLWEIIDTKEANLLDDIECMLACGALESELV